jgi:hypothetical protein
MSTPQIAFNARYSPELIEEATRTFRDYRFRRYGSTYFAACLINAVGLALALWFGAKGGAFESVVFIASTALIVFVVVSGPVWLLYQYFLEPSRQAAVLRQLLPPQLPMSIGPTTLWITTAGREIAIPVKVVVETNALFLVVLSPFAFALVPRSDLPREAFELLHGKAQPGAA